MIRPVLAARRTIGGPLAAGGGSGNLPPITAGLQFWIDGGDPTTLFQDTGLTVLVTADGQMVRGQADKSGNNRHVTEGSNGPVYKVAIQNGRSITRFLTQKKLSIVGPSLPQPNTIFVVGSANNASGDIGNFVDGNIAAGAGGSTGRHIFGATTSNQWRAFGGLNIAGGSRNTSFHVFSVIFNGASSALYVDGSSVASGDAGSTDLKMLRVGIGYDASSGQDLDGDIGEILIYSGALSSGDRTAIETWLNSKWLVY